METTLLKEKQWLFTENVRLISVKEYGYRWQDLVENSKPIPPAGARFDIAFEGSIAGEHITGTIQGIDYLEVRADSHLMLNLHASITTEDGAAIKLTESGINSHGKLRLNMSFHTSDSRYEWLNTLQVWGAGQVDFRTGEARIKGYHI